MGNSRFYYYCLIFVLYNTFSFPLIFPLLQTAHCNTSEKQALCNRFSQYLYIKPTFINFKRVLPNKNILMFLLDQNYQETDLGTLPLLSIQTGIVRIFGSCRLKCLGPRQELFGFFLSLPLLQMS